MGEARGNQEQSSEAELNLITETSPRTTKDKGPRQSEVAKRKKKNANGQEVREPTRTLEEIRKETETAREAKGARDGNRLDAT
jgi:hypothetical protein